MLNNKCKAEHCLVCEYYKPIVDVKLVGVGRDFYSIRAFCILFKNKNNICSSNELESFIWERKHVGFNSLPVLMFKLRRYLMGTKYGVISIRLKGYMLIDAQEGEDA
ncbi:MAG: helix-turn-helix domain-containing protein [Labilibaculum sp.]|nr:helix-turn-helix domain-containing protein [Labilibaculum sp.]